MGVPHAQLVKAASVGATAVLMVGKRCTLVAARHFAAGVAGDAYLQLFDAAAITDVTVGTTVPDWVVMLDQGTGDVAQGDGLPTHGLVFVNGIVAACTSTPEGNTARACHVRLAVI